jgi:tungstate transport system substrate-binding protein
MKRIRRSRLAVLAALALLTATPRTVQAQMGTATQPETIVLASTTSVENSGLLAHILPGFTRETGIEVHVVAQGTGQALATAAHGDADLVLVHDPDAESKFIAAGHGVSRQEIAWNDFIIVGPGADPAHIAGTTDVLAALRAIAAAKAPFVSRGDNSGTDALEKRLWKPVGLDPATVSGAAAGGTMAGSVWYRDIGGGMGAALNAAAAMEAYTMSDRGTWLSFGHKADLRIVLEGDPRLLNRYDVILLNPQTHPQAKQGPARRFAAWLASPEGQAAIGGYMIAGQRLFHPESDPKP